MMQLNFSEILTSALHPKVCWLLTMSLLHSLWQCAILGGIAFLIVRKNCRMDVHQRFIATFSILILIAAAPIVNFIWLSGPSKAPAFVDQATKQYVTEGGFSFRQLSLVPLAELASDAGHASVAADSSSVDSRHALSTMEDGTATNGSSLQLNWRMLGTVGVSFCYAVGVCLMLLRLGIGLKSTWGISAVCRRITCVDNVADSISAMAVKSSELFGRTRRTLQTPIGFFQGQGVAIVVGCFRPVILVNSAIVSGLTPIQIEQIVVHELAHIYRFDPLTQMAQRLIESALFFHPAVWYVSRQVTDLREMCCDDLVTKSYCRIEYADTLVACAELDRLARHRDSKSTNADPRFSLAATGSRSSQLTTRIEALLVDRSRSRSSVSFVARTILFGVAISLGVACGVAALNQSNSASFNSFAAASTQVNERTKEIVVPSWNWQSVESTQIEAGVFLFGGKELEFSETIPSDVAVHAMVVQEYCKFAQWHFGDASSTRVSILIEMDGSSVNRLFVDVNRDRVIDDSEQVVTTTNEGRTWLVGLDVEIREAGESVYSPRQVGITPKVKQRGLKSARITTLGYSEGKIELAGVSTLVRRVDLDGNGLPTESRDQIWFDLNHDGEFDLISERQHLNNYVDIGKQRYVVRSDRLGQSLLLTAKNEQGSVRFLFELADKSATLTTLEGSLRDDSGMLIAIRPSDKPVSIPTGRYCVENLVLEARDGDGHNWRMTLIAGSEDHWFDIKSGEQIDLQLLEAIKFQLTPEHHADPWTDHKTRLMPKIYTANGLVMTNFTCDSKKDAFWNTRDRSVMAQFSTRKSGVEKPEFSEPCKSGFS